MKTSVIDFLKDAVNEFSFGIRCLCRKPSPMKRFVFVLIICGILSVSFIYTLVSSIYNIGKNDARKEVLDSGNTQTGRMKKDSINYLKENQNE